MVLQSSNIKQKETYLGGEDSKDGYAFRVISGKDTHMEKKTKP